MSVVLLDHMGTDDSIVNAARVSFEKDASKFTKEENYKLLRYLAKHNHWSPFAHCSLSFRITAPVFVARQLAKHQVGFAWNEVSRRYIDTDPVVWKPSTWRDRSPSAKQGSSLSPHEAQYWCRNLYEEVTKECVTAYNAMVEAGVCPEQCRAILPLGTLTSWIWTGSLYGFNRVCKLRTAKDSQVETQDIAKQLAEHSRHCFPNAWEALEECV